MSRPQPRWNVLPHGKLVPIDDGVLTVVGNLRMPFTNLPRRMTVVRLCDSRLVIFSAIALGDDDMAMLEAFGRPAFLVVPNAHHRLDAAAWKSRYPHIDVVAPSGARKKVEQAVQVDTTTPGFDDPDVDFQVVAGTRERESALVVRTPNGTTLVLNDIVGNIRRAPGLGGRLLRLMGFAGAVPRIPGIARLALVTDRKALRAQLLGWAANESLRRILVAHGDPIEANPRQTLRELAGSLA